MSVTIGGWPFSLGTEGEWKVFGGRAVEGMDWKGGSARGRIAATAREEKYSGSVDIRTILRICFEYLAVVYRNEDEQSKVMSVFIHQDPA